MKELIISQWRLLLFGFLMSFCSSPGQTFFISLFSGYIREDLALTHGAFGGIYSLATLASAGLMIFTGPFVDKYDLRKFSIAVIAMLSIACMSISISYGMVGLFISILLLRHSGQGLMTLISSTSMVRYIDYAKGKASAIAGTGYSFSEAVMPIVIISMLTWIGWRMSWIATSLVLLLLVIPVILLLLNTHSIRHKEYLAQFEVANNSNKLKVKKQWTRSEVLKDRCFYLIIPALLAHPMMFTGFIFHQIHLVETKAWPLEIWGGFFTAYALTAISFNLISGFLIDRFGSLKILPFVPIPLALALLSISFFSDLFIALVFLLLLGLTSGMMSTVSGPIWAELYGSKHLGSIKSIGVTSMVFSSASSPFILGALIDINISIETLALYSAVLVLITSLIAIPGCRIGLARNPSA